MNCLQEQALHTRNNGVETFIIGVYVDDLMVTSTSVEGFKEFMQQMMKDFDMTDLELLTYYLGMEVDQRKYCIMLKQSTYANKLLLQFKMTECNPTKYIPWK